MDDKRCRTEPEIMRIRLTKGLLQGVDGRTVGAVRFKRLVNSISADLGGMAALSEAERGLVRQAASLIMRAEQLQSAIARGEQVDPDELIRLTNTVRRTLAGGAASTSSKPATTKSSSADGSGKELGNPGSPSWRQSSGCR
jgi:hypothetical protein